MCIRDSIRTMVLGFDAAVETGVVNTGIALT